MSGREPPPGLFDLEAFGEAPAPRAPAAPESERPSTSSLRLRSEAVAALRGVRPKALPAALRPAAMTMQAFAEAAPKPRPERHTRGGTSRAREQMREMAAKADWSGATGSHFVALYEWLHATVYEVEASELSVVKEWTQAAAAASRMLHDYFADDTAAMVNFLRWTWKKERETEAWRRDNGRPGRRIGWRLQFGHALVTDYRLDSRRRSSAGTSDDQRREGQG